MARMSPRQALVLALVLILGAGRTAFGQEPSAPLGPDGAPFDDTQGRHGDGHAENHDWYRKLEQPGTGFPCCNGTEDGIEGDCRPTRAYLAADGLWYALLDGSWVPVPPR